MVLYIYCVLTPMRDGEACREALNDSWSFVSDVEVTRVQCCADRSCWCVLEDNSLEKQQHTYTVEDKLLIENN